MRLRYLRVVVVFLAASSTLGQNASPKPVVSPLSCAGGDCPILRGVPESKGMRSGFVRLPSGASVGWHSTERNEEQLVVLHGRGEALVEGQAATPFQAPCAVYISPATRHNVSNTGTEMLEYVYVVAPASP
ncbi:MAG TPA: cupin domain-containing protein [Terriglobales bacterium]|nr:cupin domain-containing protein [Terriglobales bacterium]